MTTPYPSPWPANFQGCLLTGKFIGFNGLPVAGTLTLIPTPEELLDVAAGLTIVTSPRTVTLAADGSIKGWDGTAGSAGVEVPATDDPDINPTAWTYTINENWTGGRKGYSIRAPQGVTVDLVNVRPVPSSGGQPIYRGAAGIPLGSVAPPASAVDAGSPGEMAYDAGFVYVCVATDTWKRVALSTW